MAIVIGMAPSAFAEDVAPDAGASVSEAAAEPTLTADPSPAPEPAPDLAPEPAPEPAPGPAGSTSVDATGGPAAPAAGDPAASGPDAQQTTTQTKVKSFSPLSPKLIDPLAAEAPADPDWIWQGGAPTQEDGEKDTTAYGGGSSEATDPSTWTQASADTPKADLLKYYLNVDTSGDVIVSFGFTRKSNNGDTAFAVEFNQLENTSGNPPQPNRTVGDLLLKFHMDPSADAFTFAHAYIWTAASDFGDYPLGCFSPSYTGGAFGWCEISKAGFDGRTSDDNFTAEGRVNLTTLFEHNDSCSGFFNSVNLRGESSAENWTNSLQDYLGTPGASVPSTCANLVIRKFEAGTSTLLTGAEFDVYAGTGTGGTLLYDNLADGDAADTDGVAGQITLAGIEPGTYTVVEVVPPTGYFLPADPEQTLTVGDNGEVVFPFYDVRQWQALDVSKSAAGSYDATYNWDIQKKVAADANSPFLETLTKNVPDDGDGPSSAPFTYQVEVTQGARETSNIQVSGSVLVDNPNDRPVDITLSDKLADNTVCTFADPTVTVPANAVDQAYSYTCSYPANTAPADLSTTNNVTITWDKSTYPQTAADALLDGNYSDTASDTVEWTAHETNKTVTITDDHHVFDPAWTITWTAPGTTETRTYTRSVESGAGNCHTETNTAFVKDGTQVLDSDDATAKVCVGKDLVVSKVSQESLTRTYAWDITKTSNDGTLIVDPQTGKATASFDILVQAGAATDKDWMMSGSITVVNPNRWEDVVVTDLTDVYSGGDADDCSIDGWGSMTTADKTIPATGDAVGSKTFDYTCVFDSKPAYDGTNTATVEWDEAAATSPTGTDSFDLAIHESDWTLDAEIDKTVTIWDDNAGTTDDPTKLGELVWSDGLSETFEYTVDLTAPPGECQTWTNTATVNGDGGVELDTSSDDVKVCNAKLLDVSKTATGSFERTYDWGIDKQISADNGQTWSSAASSGPIDVWSHTFDYRVVLEQLGWDDHDFTMTGSIRVSNPNTDPAIAPISSTLTEAPEVGVGTECVVLGGPDDGDALTGYSTGPIASGGHVDVGYRCTLADDAPVYSGAGVKNVVTATNASTASASAPVTFVKGAVDRDTAVIGDSLYDGLPDAAVPFDESDPDRTYTYDYELTHTADSADCDNTWVNTATVVSDLAILDQDTATATVCPTPGTWQVSKTSDSDGPVAVGSTITYTLTAEKLGGVNPEDVVVNDDLNALLAHTSDPAAITPSVGTTSFENGVLTWNIPELSGTETLTFTVTVDADAFGVDLPNLVTSPGSENCPDQDAATAVDECTTDSDTPAYSLEKDSDAGETVMPPYLGADGTTITYTLTVKNTSDAPINADTMPGATVTDDLSDVLDNATFDDASITGDGEATRDGNTLTWVLPEIPVGGEASISYQVTVNEGAWNATLANTATPGLGGTCVTEDGCETTTDTPEVTHMSVKKVNAETGEGLADAEFTLFADLEPFADASDPVIGDEDLELGTAASGDDGLAVFGADLLQGHFLVQETKAPEGYALPLEGDTMAVVVDDSNFVASGTMAPFIFRDPAEGHLAIVAKQQFELNDANEWELSDGIVDYGDTLKYVVKVEAVGPKLFHDVEVTDYVPGYNPLDTTTTVPAELVAGTPECTGGLECEVSVGEGNLVTWKLGTVHNAAGDITMVVKFPEAPENPLFDENGEYINVWWNVGYLDWFEEDFAPIQQQPLRTSARKVGKLVPMSLTSNEVVARATLVQVVEPPVVNPPVVNPPVVNPPVVNPPQTNPPGALPNTGAPSAWIPVAGLGLLLLGGWLMVEKRLRRRRA